ncbi:cysteine--tRNA ligase [soil metagenome]
MVRWEVDVLGQHQHSAGMADDTPPLRLFNSLSRAIEAFVPIVPGAARVYSCGPTVYNYAHLGNLRAYVFTDTLRRALLWKGYAVTHIINITDVGHLTSDADAGDDKMEAAARAQARSIWDIAAHYTQAFKANIAALNIIAPSEWTVATDYVPQMIDFAGTIADKHCYILDSGLYFDVSTVPHYGRLARSTEDEVAGEIGGRIDPVAGKRHAQDFAIWRASPPGEQRQMEWDSPWGKGAPGWHLECSVMSHAKLGHPFDIHTGGIDHREIHHPNEIAQNQAFCACTDAQPDFTGARWWMHNNFLVDRGGKMSKSKGGFTTLFSLIDRGVHPLAYRLLCLSAHYRSELEFSGDIVGAALTRLKRLVMAADGLRGEDQSTVSHPRLLQLLDEFDVALSDDLNTPKALTVLDEVLAQKKIGKGERLAAVARIDAALGLNLLSLSRADLRIAPKDAAITAAEIEAELDRRQAARGAKDFAASDAIRDALMARGVEVMDGDPLRWEWTIKLD